jgi:uncharacterized iron-regulated membrane protein
MLSSLRKLWFEPRRSSLRLWMLRIHTWAGVGTGLYLAMMGLTGGLSVFLPELRDTLVPPIHVAAGQQHLSLQTLQSNIEKSNPGFRLRRVYPGQTAVQADRFEEQTQDKTIREIVVDPYSARILINGKKDVTFYDWVRDLHANLLSGETGKTINGFGGILLLLTGLAGIVVWWPGRRHLTAGTFRISAHKSWHRLSFDLHRLAGVLILLPLSVAAITGVGLAFPQLTGHVVSAALGPESGVVSSKSDKRSEQKAAVEKGGPRAYDTQARGKNDVASRKLASLDDIVNVASEQIPGATPVRIQAPAGKNGGYVVWMHLPSDWRDEGDNRVLVDGNSATLLGVQLGRNRSLSSRVIEGATAVHYGQFGGIPTRIFAVIVGLTLPLLYITGMALWWRRVNRRRPKTTVQAVSSVVPAADDVYAVETQ